MIYSSYRDILAAQYPKARGNKVYTYSRSCATTMGDNSRSSWTVFSASITPSQGAQWVAYTFNT